MDTWVSDQGGRVHSGHVLDYSPKIFHSFTTCIPYSQLAYQTLSFYDAIFCLVQSALVCHYLN